MTNLIDGKKIAKEKQYKCIFILVFKYNFDINSINKNNYY